MKLSTFEIIGMLWRWQEWKTHSICEDFAYNDKVCIVTSTCMTALDVRFFSEPSMDWLKKPLWECPILALPVIQLLRRRLVRKLKQTTP